VDVGLYAAKGVRVKSPLLNTLQIAERLAFVDRDGRVNARAALEWLDRHKVPTKWRGRSVLAHEDDVDAALKTRTRRAS
jgi:hypothetical protein